MNTNVSPVDMRSPESLCEDDLKWYAGLAMQAMIAKQGIPDTQSEREEIALWAYRMAEAMVRTTHRLKSSSTE